MQNAQQQLQLLEDAMSARKNIDVITEETNRLKQKLTERQETLNRLQKLCIAASSLLNSVDSSAEETEISSLQCLSKLDQSTAVSPTEPENEGDEFKLLVRSGEKIESLCPEKTGGLSFLSADFF